jgi:hypothetical protein
MVIESRRMRRPSLVMLSELRDLTPYPIRWDIKANDRWLSCVELKPPKVGKGWNMFAIGALPRWPNVPAMWALFVGFQKGLLARLNVDKSHTNFFA